jgi:DNA mismatch endonuclease, patch repair protein
MAAIRSKNTKPELLIRKLVFAMGYRYRLHSKKLIGKPDLVFPKLKKVIFVHGCFWHKHSCRYGRVIPKTNAKFWEDKRNGNVERDAHNLKILRKTGWEVFVIWECRRKNLEALIFQISAFLKA